jgi:hypothetical protein
MSKDPDEITERSFQAENYSIRVISRKASFLGLNKHWKYEVVVTKNGNEEKQVRATLGRSRRVTSAAVPYTLRPEIKTPSILNGKLILTYLPRYHETEQRDGKVETLEIDLSKLA